MLNRVQYGKPPLTERQATFIGQLANFWQYFSWQFARDWGRLRRRRHGALHGARPERPLGALEVGSPRRRRGGLALLGTLSVGLVFYMNFKYGFSLYPDQPSLPREVRERDYFFIGSFAVFGAFVALGLGALMQAIVDVLSDRGTADDPLGRRSPVLALALVPLLGNRPPPAGRTRPWPATSRYDMLESVEPYGILITAGDNDTFPLWYAQEVEGIRRDVTLANLSLMNTEWHLRQLRRRETPAFDPAKRRRSGSPAPSAARRRPTPALEHLRLEPSSTACPRRCGCRPKAASRSTASRSASARTCSCARTSRRSS